MEFTRIIKKYRVVFVMFLILVIGNRINAQNTDNLNKQEMVSLSGEWLFKLVTPEKSSKVGKFYDNGYSLAGFDKIKVPSNWSMLGYEEPVYRYFENDKGNEGLYVKHFSLPKGWDGKRVVLRFGGVWQSCEVWLNGKFVGEHHNGFTTFGLNITKQLNAKGDNLLAVRVKQTDFGYKMDLYDDWSLPGIYRDVMLESYPKNRWIETVVARTDFDYMFEDADLTIKALVADAHPRTLPGNYNEKGKPYHIKCGLYSLDGNLVAETSKEIPSHISTSRETTIKMHVNNPRHWTAETPNLYLLKVSLLEESGITQVYEQRIGFRQIDTANGIFRINGQAVKLRGVNRHDEYPTVGRATNREHWLKDIMLMKKANVNYIRCSHYTPARGFIELCDSLGMYVGNEVALGGSSETMYNSAFLGRSQERAYETVIRDINSPSIIYWSVSNESPFTELQLAAIKTVKVTDPTRPVLMPWRFEQWMPKEVDMLSIHYWHPNEYDAYAGNSNRPFISTEYTHAYGTKGMGGLEDRWKAMTQHAAGTGAAIWMWADQGLTLKTKTPEFKANELNNGDPYLRVSTAGWDGITDSYRNPTDDYWEARAVYAQVYPNVQRVNFKEGDNRVRIPIKNDFDFTNLDNIKISWTLKANAQEIDGGETAIAGAPHAVAGLDVPLGKLNAYLDGIVEKGETGQLPVLYLVMSFRKQDGEEIITRSVELQSDRVIQEVSKIKNPVSVIDKYHYKVGDKTFSFEQATGHLVSLKVNDKQMIEDVRPTIWHKWDNCETTSVKKENRKVARDLNNYQAKNISWEVIKQSQSLVVIKAVTEYVVNENNKFAVEYRYMLSDEGKLMVHYEMTPSVQTTLLPEVGLRITGNLQMTDLSWVGLGPYDAYPNRHCAAYFGLWGGSASDKATDGYKQMRRLDWTAKNKKGITITADNYYLSHSVETPNVVSILSDLYARPEKGRAANDWWKEMNTGKDAPFCGNICIE